MKLRFALTATLALAGLVALPATADAAATGSISGIVRADGQPRAGAGVVVIAMVDTGFFGRGPRPIAFTETDANGRYRSPD